MVGVVRFVRMAGCAVWLVALGAVACAGGGAAPAHPGGAPTPVAPASSDTVAEGRNRAVRDSTDAAALVRGGRLRLDAGQDSLAALDFTEARRLEPRLADPLVGLTMIGAFTAVHQLDSALAHARYLTERRPENGLWWVVIGRVLLLRNRIEEARAAFERGFRLRPGLVDSLPPIDRSAWQELERLRRQPPR